MLNSSRKMTCVALAAFGSLTNCMAVYANDFAPAERSKAAMEHVARLEHQLGKLLRLEQRGFASPANVDAVRANLLKAKHDLAGSKGDRKGMAKLNAALLEVRQRELQRQEAMKRRGKESRLQLTKARRRVAVCRYLVAAKEDRKAEVADALHEAVQLCEQEVEFWKSAVAKRHAPRVELSFVLNRLACGRNLLAKEDGRPEEIAKHLQNAVDLLQGDLDMVRKLRERGASTIFEELFSQSSLLNAKVRLASAQGQTDLVHKHVSTLVQANERLLAVMTKPSSLTHLPQNIRSILKSSIATDLERDRLRLKAVSLGLAIQDDLSVATLGP